MALCLRSLSNKLVPAVQTIPSYLVQAQDNKLQTFHGSIGNVKCKVCRKDGEIPMLRKERWKEDFLPFGNLDRLDLYKSYSFPEPRLAGCTESRVHMENAELSEVKVASVPDPETKNIDGPTAEQLEKIYLTLSKMLPELFTTQHDYSIYHKDLIFENNIRGVRTVGLHYYIKQIALLKLIGHFKFAYIKLEVLKITRHPEDNSVKVRWRIRGVSSLRVILTFWKIKLWALKSSLESPESWFDGFSTFYVGSDGVIHKHVVDKVMPSSNEEIVKPATLGAKLALLFGLTISRQGLSSLNALFFKFFKQKNASSPTGNMTCNSS
ncbi:uncharacterized protein C6orf136 [Cimex lectularius]|uniref:Uncharacterized protein n=1 Tax=Cimex lectularius TaxID=79782 RepID=A0A8I6RUE5_CIMLE|nr:uncharacterized protein C6orf136 [Cimex lectularius]